MMTREEINDSLEAVRARILEVASDHEIDVHGGNPCWPNRASMIAWVAHSLGIHRETPLWDRVGELLDEYDACCPGCPAHLAVRRGGDRA